MKLENGKNNITFLGSNFKEWFDLEVKPVKIKLTTKTLERNMLDKEILAELKPTEITLDEFIGQLGFLDKNEWYFGYIKDKNGVLRAVDVGWGGDGWVVVARSVEDPGEWFAGSRVMSRIEFDLPNPAPIETLPLELTINGVI